MLELKSGFITFSLREQTLKEYKLVQQAVNIAFKIYFEDYSLRQRIIRLINSFYTPMRVIRSEKNVPRKEPVTPRFPFR